MESYHDYLEHVRSHKYIRKERTPSGRWRYYYYEKKKKPLLVKDTPITNPGDLDEIHNRYLSELKDEEQRIRERESAGFRSEYIGPDTNKRHSNYKKSSDQETKNFKKPLAVKTTSIKELNEIIARQLKEREAKEQRIRERESAGFRSKYYRSDIKRIHPKDRVFSKKKSLLRAKRKVDGTFLSYLSRSKDIEKKISTGKKYVSRLFD